MKRIVTGLAAVAALIGTPALAADMVTKAPPPPPAPTWSWAGAYVGINGGYGWNDSTGNFACTAPGGGGVGCPIWSTAVRPEGGLFGGQIGYNKQNGTFVYGVETDLQWSGIRASPTFAFPATTPIGGGGALGVASTFNTTQNLQWFGTARVRLGITAAPQALIYVTGGLIYGHESVSFNNTLPATAYLASGGSTQVGGTVGGGVEYAFNPTLSGKIEGLYYDMGSQSLTYANPATGFTDTESYVYRGAIIRGGLNLKFNWPGPMAAPMATK